MKKERTDRTREQPEHKLYDAVRARRLKDIQNYYSRQVRNQLADKKNFSCGVYRKERETFKYFKLYFYFFCKKKNVGLPLICSYSN